MKVRLIMLLFLLIILGGCSSKKISNNESIEEIKKSSVDSAFVIKNDKEYVSKPINIDYLFEIPCDTLSGKLKDINQNIKSGDSKVNIKSDKGSLRVKIDIDSVSSYWRNHYKNTVKVDTIYRNKEVIKKVEKVKYKTPLWMWIVLIIAVLIIYLLIRF